MGVDGDEATQSVTICMRILPSAGGRSDKILWTEDSKEFPLAWNLIPAAEDENLSFQAYYVRLNILGMFLSPLGRQVLEAAWEDGASDSLRPMRRSAIIGLIAGDLIRALALGESHRVV